MGRETFFQKNAFHWGTNFEGQIYERIVLHGRTNDEIHTKGGGVSQNAFSSDLNTVNLKFFNHGGIFT